VRLLRGLLAQGRRPECWIPPEHILERRALLECYHDLPAEHTAYVQRIHATLFHQGAPAFYGLRQANVPEQLTALARVRSVRQTPASDKVGPHIGESRETVRGTS